MILVSSFYLNYFLSAYKSTIEEISSGFIRKEVSIQSSYFIPPNKIILNNISVLKNGPYSEEEFASLEEVELTFDLKKLILNRRLELSKLHLKRPSVKSVDYEYFSKEGNDRLIGIINSFGKGIKLEVVLEDASFVLSEPVEESGYLVVNTVSRIKPDKSLYSKGNIALKDFTLKENLVEGRLDYAFEGRFVKSGLIINNLEIQKENAYLKIWGELKNNLLRLNANVFSFKSIGRRDLLGTNFELVDKFIKFLRYKIAGLVQIIAPPAVSDFNIFDLGCLVRFVPDGFKLENLSFSLKSTPFCAKGGVVFLEEPSINLRLSSFPNQPEKERLENPKSFDLYLEGIIRELKFNGKVELDFLRNISGKKLQQKIGTEFENLGVSFLEDKQFKVFFDEANFYYKADTDSMEVPVSDFQGALVSIDGKNISAQFDSMVYEGFLEGKGRINIASIPFKSTFELNISEVDTNKLSSALVYLSKVYGKFNSKIYYSSYPCWSLKGNLSIDNGYLDNLMFFSWLADFFNIEALRRVDFEKVSANFSLSKELYRLENISLQSKDVKLSGYFDIFQNNLVSGRLSLGLSDTLLNTSPKFKRLLKLIGKDLSSVNFDFQTSGFYETMNFKWLESEFKMRLQKLLPSGMERKIQEEIEQAVESISKEE